MRNLNLVAIDGNLVADPKTTLQESGKSFTTFDIGVSRSQSEADFFKVKVWDLGTYRLAELCAEYLAKGRRVTVRGRLRQERWIDQDSSRRSAVVIIADDVIFLDSPTREDRPAASAAPIPRAPKAPTPTGAVAAGRPPEPEIDPDDIPF